MNCRSRLVTCCPSKRTYVEPIFQAYVKSSDPRPIRCLSTKCDHCLNEYFEARLPLSHCQAFHNRKDTFDMGRPNAIVTSPNIIIDEDEMQSMQNEAIGKLQARKKFRKRYALMQMNEGVFILGGYIVDSETGEKKFPVEDYFYENERKEFRSIPPLPNNGRMGFGLAASDDDQVVVVGGHDFNYRTISNVAILDMKNEKLQWRNLPDILNGSVGPGVSVIDNVLYVIGGFDFLGHDVVCNGDVLLMHLDGKQWRTLSDIDPPRARPLISATDHNNPPSLIVAGGYTFDKAGKTVPCGQIEEYDRQKKRWQVIANIPNFQTSNGLVTKHNKLYLMETSEETGETRIVKRYNLETHQWESSQRMSKGREEKTEE